MAVGPRKVEKPTPGDTEPDFPEKTKGPVRSDKNSSGLDLRTSDLGGWAHPAVAPTAKPDLETLTEPVSMLRPLVVFVLLPLTLVAAVMLIWWLVGW